MNFTASQVSTTVSFRPYELRLDRSVSGYTDAVEITDSSGVVMAYMGKGTNDMYGLTWGQGSSWRGAMWLRRRSVATTKPGTLIMENANGVSYFITVDNDGKLRINTTDPNGNDTTGTIVGTQS